jgi:hypothetical protein
MPIAQIWKKAHVSSPYILESVECNMCERQIKTMMRMTRYAQSKERCTDWAAPVRLVPLIGQTGQVQLEHSTGRHQSDRCP